MRRFLWLLPALLGLVSLQAQRARFGNFFPPEVKLDRFIDVAKVDARDFTVEADHGELRVLRARLGPDARVPFHDDRSGVIVAITDVHLRFTTPDKKFRDIHMKAGETHWIDGDAFSEQNLSSSPCEFVYVETRSAGGPVPYTPPV